MKNGNNINWCKNIKIKYQVLKRVISERKKKDLRLYMMNTAGKQIIEEEIRLSHFT